MSRQFPVVGIVGSIGSGKSAVAAGIAERLGGLHIDADAISHELLHDADVKKEILEAFGPQVFLESGEIRRQSLAELVFGTSAEQVRRRRQLEAVLHPRIQNNILQRMAAAQSDGATKLILLDAAVLLEAGWQSRCDVLICVDAARSTRLKRVANRGWNDNELVRREQNQWTIDDKIRYTDFLLDNSGALTSAVDAAVGFLLKQFPHLNREVAEIT